MSALNWAGFQPIGTGQGSRVGEGPGDDREIAPNKASVFTPGAGTSPFIQVGRRFDGLAFWSREEGLEFRFIGGTAEENCVPTLSTPQAISLIASKLLESEAFTNTLIETLFETQIETVIEKLADSDEFKDAFWSKEELKAMTSAEYAAAKAIPAGQPGSIPSGTIVMVKED